MATALFRVRGLCCAEEVATLRRELSPLPGVEDMAFDLLQARMTVRYAPDKITPDELVAAVKRTGMTASSWAGPSWPSPPQSSRRWPVSSRGAGTSSSCSDPCWIGG